VPGKGGVALFNVVDAKPLGFISSGDALTPDVSFHPDGKRAAVTVSNRLIVYDLQAGQELTSATLPHPIGQQGWVGKDLLLTHLGSLIRTDLEMSVWQYSHSGRGTARAVPGGVLLATSGGSCNVASLNIPHKGLREASDQLERGGDAAMLVRPGSQVALAAELIDGVDRAQVLAALRTAVDRTGWKIAEKADIQVVAIIGRGMTEELQYRLPVPGVDRNSAPIQTANLTPFTARLEIRRSGQVLWSRNTTNYAPTIVFIKDGEELQNVIKNYERPNPEFFARLTIPPRIPKPELARGLGMSVPDGFAWKDLSAAPNGAKRAGK